MTLLQALYALIEEFIGDPERARICRGFSMNALQLGVSGNMRWLSGDDPPGLVGPAYLTIRPDYYVQFDAWFALFGERCRLVRSADGTELVVPGVIMEALP